MKKDTSGLILAAQVVQKMIWSLCVIYVAPRAQCAGTEAEISKKNSECIGIPNISVSLLYLTKMDTLGLILAAQGVQKMIWPLSVIYVAPRTQCAGTEAEISKKILNALG